MSESTEHEEVQEPITVVAIPKSYWHMTDDEKHEFVTQLLRGFRPKLSDTSDHDQAE
jgi:hypothetical protein